MNNFTELLNDPVLYYLLTIGFTVGMFFFLRWRYPYECEMFWRKVVKNYHMFMHVGTAVVFTTAIFGIISLYFYTPQVRIAMQTASPKLYEFVETYSNVWFMILYFLLAVAAGHIFYIQHMKGLDKDDRKLDKTNAILMQELLTAYHTLQEDNLEVHQVLHLIGDREMENPTRENGLPNRRKGVKNIPSIPPTKEEIIARSPIALETLAQIEQEIKESLEEEVDETEKEPVVEVKKPGPFKHIPIVSKKETMVTAEKVEYNKIDQWSAKALSWTVSLFKKK